MQTYSRRQTKMGATVIAAALLAGAGGLIFAAGVRSVQSAPTKGSSSEGWQTYKDARMGFTVERPAGWLVRADSHSIAVQDPSRREVMLMEMFTAAPGDSAEAHLNRLAQEQAALFPDAEISGAAPQPSKGDAVAATLSYGNGAGAGRVLCSIVRGRGLLFVLAAPGGSFAADQPVLTRIVKSLRFIVPAASKGPVRNAGRLAAAQAAAAVRELHFVPWTEPHEHGFQVDVPRGWTADGGVFHTGPTDLRIAYMVTSPAKDMQVIMGDPRLPSIVDTPNEMLGAREGINGCSHYMLAPEFNHWYLNGLGKQSMDHLTIGADHPLPEIARQKTIQAQETFGSSGEVEASVGVTEFSGLSKLTHKQITGVVIGTTQRVTTRGFRAPMTTWVPSAIVLICNDDAGKVRRQQIIMAVFARIENSYHEDPAWVSKLSQQGAASGEQKRHQMEKTTGDIIERSRRRSAEITRSSDAARDASMGAYWGHVNADNEQQRRVINQITDRTDVSGGGETTNVQSGSSYYYRNGQTGTVIGTDSADSPGVDFTPLTER